MSTFVVRIVRAKPGVCAGIIRFVATGEEWPFTNLAELMSLVEEQVWGLVGATVSRDRENEWDGNADRDRLDDTGRTEEADRIDGCDRSD